MDSTVIYRIPDSWLWQQGKEAEDSEPRLGLIFDLSPLPTLTIPGSRQLRQQKVFEECEPRLVQIKRCLGPSILISTM